jgi:hypothetical protein
MSPKVSAPPTSALPPVFSAPRTRGRGNCAAVPSRSLPPFLLSTRGLSLTTTPHVVVFSFFCTQVSRLDASNNPPQKRASVLADVTNTASADVQQRSKGGGVEGAARCKGEVGEGYSRDGKATTATADRRSQGTWKVRRPENHFVLFF